MHQGHQGHGQGGKAQQIHIPAPVQVQIGQAHQGRAGEEEKIGAVNEEGAVDVNADCSQAQQDQQVPPVGLAAHVHLPGAEEVQRQPDEARVIHKALVGQGVPEVHPVGGNEHGHDAAQQRRRDGEADHLVPGGGGLCEGNVEHDENLHGAQMKGQRIGGQGAAALRRGEHMGHHFAGLAENGNDQHRHPGGFGIDVLSLCGSQAKDDGQRTQPKPDKMIDGKHHNSFFLIDFCRWANKLYQPL